MQENDHVPPNRICIVGSSGLQPANNKDELQGKVSTLSGKTMTFINVTKEVENSINGLIPTKYSNTSILIDIGSGNTKGGFKVRPSATTTEDFSIISVPYGTVTFTDAVKKFVSDTNTTTFVRQADTLANSLISLPLRQQISKKVEYTNRNRVYLSGGIVWAMTTLLHPENRRIFIGLTPQDINRFYDQVVSNPDSLLNPDLSKIANTEVREAAQQDIERIKTTFTPTNLIAGAKIMKVLSTELRFQNKKVYFHRQSHIGWLFSYIADLNTQKPPDNRLYGGIEIGSKGIKAIVVRFVGDVDSDSTKLRQVGIANVGIMVEVAKTGRFSKEAIEDAGREVKKFYTEMIENDHVPIDHMCIVGSSGLQPASQTSKDELKDKIYSLTGQTITFIDSYTEIINSINGIIPVKYNNVSMLIDVGSGNTKGGYRVRRASYETKDDTYVTLSIPSGTVTFTDAIKKSTPDTNNVSTFVKQTDSLADELISIPLRDQIDRKPGLLNRNRAYLSGGIVWAMTTLLHPENRRIYISITPQDINKFYDQVVNNSDGLLNPDLSKIADPEVREAAQQDIENIKSTFTPSNLIAGAKIMKALSTELRFQNKQLYFHRQSQIGWLFSYITKINEK